MCCPINKIQHAYTLYSIELRYKKISYQFLFKPAKTNKKTIILNIFRNLKTKQLSKFFWFLNNHNPTVENDK